MNHRVRRFQGDLKRFSENLQRRAAGSAAALGAVTRRQVALATPFDTGRAAASWNASLNGANLRVQPDEVKFASRQVAARAGETNLQGIRLGDSIHISNNLPYIRRLNAGSSRQAPSNFVEMTAQKTQARRGAAITSRMLGSLGARTESE